MQSPVIVCTLLKNENRRMRKKKRKEKEKEEEESRNVIGRRRRRRENNNTQNKYSKATKKANEDYEGHGNVWVPYAPGIFLLVVGCGPRALPLGRCCRRLDNPLVVIGLQTLYSSADQLY